jgi:hypothetical protein
MGVLGQTKKGLGLGLGLRAKKGRSFRYMDGLESSNTSIETDCAGQGFELARVRSAGGKYVRQIGWGKVLGSIFL